MIHTNAHTNPRRVSPPVNLVATLTARLRALAWHGRWPPFWTDTLRRCAAAPPGHRLAFSS